MATADVRNIINAPGRLCHSPSSLSSAFPHGGTSLGTTRSGRLVRYWSSHQIRDEAFGIETRDVVWSGENWALSLILREWDDDAVAALFPNTSTGAVSQHKVVATPGTNRPGLLLSEKKVVLLFSPDDVERVPAVLFYAALPMFEDRTEVDLAFGKRMELACSFLATRNTSGLIHKSGRLVDLSLT